MKAPRSSPRGSICRSVEGSTERASITSASTRRWRSASSSTAEGATVMSRCTAGKRTAMRRIKGTARMAAGPEPRPSWSWPVAPVRRRSATARSSSASATRRRARASTSRPKAVGSLRQPMRSSRGCPSSSSRLRMLRLSAGWVMNRASAERVKEPVSAREIRCRSWTRVMECPHGGAGLGCRSPLNHALNALKSKKECIGLCALDFLRCACISSSPAVTGFPAPPRRTG